MPKPTNAKAPALPDAQKVKQTKGALMRKKSDNIVKAAEGRRNSQDIRVDWSKLVKGKGKGKGKGRGKGKKGESKWVKKKVPAAEGSEERTAAVEKLEKNVEKKRRDSLSEIIRIDKSLAPKKPKFKKVKTIQPEAKGLNLMLKCVKCEKVEGDTPTWEAVCGDETGVVTFSLRSEVHADLCKAGASLRVQNAKVLMMKGHVKAVVDKWAVMKAADAAHDFEVSATNDVSATEYELTA